GLFNTSIKGIGVSSAGPLLNGVIMNPPNLPIRNFNIKKFLKKKYKVKVEVENDANCVALAESRIGVKKKNFFILTLGTGIGGGVIINGELYTGNGYAGELGHVVINGDGDMEDRWRYHIKRAKKHFGSDILIKDMIKNRDPKCQKIISDMFDTLSKGIGSLINVFDPDVVVLNGGVKEIGDLFIKPIRKRVSKYVIIPKKYNIVWSKLYKPNLVGASFLVS
ncbi:ROK family protein, partial [Candidatus Pacearchaeota archaeon]|nr:ROK family protein [Candidatus Pacearchaeota archaeon]